MPNYCENSLRISGPTNKIDEFIEAVTDGDGNINIASQHPMPETLRDTSSPTADTPEPHPNWKVMLDNGEITQEWYDELCADRRNRYENAQKAKAETGYTDWYDWALDNWGTKWGDFDHYQNIRYVDEHELGYMTAWGPFSDKFWIEVSKKYPELTFTVTYDEPGMCFVGAGKYSNGETLFTCYIDDVTPLLGELDYEDDDARDKWYEAKADLLGSLLEQFDAH